jgi:outer membrane protein
MLSKPYNYMKTITKTTIIIFILLAGIIAWQTYEHFTRHKTGYVVVSEVYSGFELKKEMEKKYLATSNARQKILDSLILEIKLMEKKVDGKPKVKSSDTLGYHDKIEEYLLKKQTYDEDNTALTQKYDEQIITQLNQYIKDYGEAYNYTYIFGTGGNGTLMYADEGENITKDVIEYINKKYNGEK